MTERQKGQRLLSSPQFQLQIITVIFITLCSLPNPVRTTPTNDGLCTTKYIRNYVTDLAKLNGCRVIEGNLQISLMEHGSPELFKNYSFPELREISGYFLLSSVNGLQSLRHLFPNLAVIRGQDFIHDYAFIIYEMPDLQEIGLPSLTNIMNRGVFINDNKNLCYVDTIDWGLITNNSSQEVFIHKNMPNDQCPNICGDQCPKSDSDSRHLCWTNEDCQKVEKSCNCSSGLCYGENLCCSAQCLGGCSGSSPRDCHVCKYFENDFEGIICMPHCGDGTFEYLNRRCVREDECYSILNFDPKFKARRRGKILFDQRKCVLECPKGYLPKMVNSTAQICEKCKYPCKKECVIDTVDSNESAKLLKECTHIKGSLKIQIRGYSQNLMDDLRNNLDMIQEIEDSLIIVNSPGINSLDFLKALKYIHGKKLQSGFAVEVKFNDNIRELWGNQTAVTISNPIARVLFHYNPRLCPHKIWDFVNKSTINIPIDNKIDIGTTNGDKVPCNEVPMVIYEVSKSRGSVTIKWENFRRHLLETNHLLNYEIHYKISPIQNASIYQERDICGNDDWVVTDAEKMDFNGTQDMEPEFEELFKITGLQYFMQYAFYVKTMVIPLPDSNYNVVGGISPVCYITTLPDVPSQPTDVKFTATSSTSIKLEWSPPLSPNGVIEKYKIYIKDEGHDVHFLNQRDYCEGRPESAIKKQIPPPTTQTPPNEDCCSCSKKPKKVTASRALHLTDISDSITNAVFLSGQFSPSSDVKNRRRRRGIGSDYYIRNYSENSPEVFPGAQIAGMDLIRIVDVSEAKAVGDFEVILQRLAHYGRYTIAIIACRDHRIRKQMNGCKEKIHSSEEGATSDIYLCSEPSKQTLNTLHSPTADLIETNTIRKTVRSNRLTLSWIEPLHPNGVVVGYRINVTRVDSGGTNDAPLFMCITSQQFQKVNHQYEFPASLNPGNYSVQIQVLSLAPYESNYTVPSYFLVHKIDEGMSTGQLLAILLPIFSGLLMGVGILIYVVRTKQNTIKIISANPEYLENVNIPREWEVERSNIKKLSFLRKGSFGIVYRGILNKNGVRIPCAIKTVRENSTSDDRHRFFTEASMMTQMDCHHVVRLLGVVTLSRPTYVIMELMEFGDLKQYLISRRPQPPTLRQVLRMAAEIADGMAYLNKQKYVHRDLAARNCMVAADLTVKVGDFGMTKDVMETDYYRKETTGRLPVRWMAPESIRDGIFTIQSDVWSYGIVLWEIATLADKPYDGLENEEVIRFISDGGIMERPENCTEVLFNMMLRCWQPTPQARPAFTEILKWLLPECDASFAQVSFYHNHAGTKHNNGIQSKNDITSSETPFLATFGYDLFAEDDEIDVGMAIKN